MLLTFLESLKIVLINMVIILMMQAKIATPGLLKRKVFWNKGYDVIIFARDVTNKILSHDSSYVVNVVMWLKFGNSSISTRYSQFYKDLTKKFAFLRDGLRSGSIIWDWN